MFTMGWRVLSMRPDVRFREIANFSDKQLNINELTLFF